MQSFKAQALPRRLHTSRHALWLPTAGHNVALDTSAAALTET